MGTSRRQLQKRLEKRLERELKVFREEVCCQKKRRLYAFAMRIMMMEHLFVILMDLAGAMKKKELKALLQLDDITGHFYRSWCVFDDSAAAELEKSVKQTVSELVHDKNCKKGAKHEKDDINTGSVAG